MDLLFCHHCGNVIREKDKFCSECGLKVSSISATRSSRANINLQPLKAGENRPSAPVAVASPVAVQAQPFSLPDPSESILPHTAPAASVAGAQPQPQPQVAPDVPIQSLTFMEEKPASEQAADFFANAVNMIPALRSAPTPPAVAEQTAPPPAPPPAVVPQAVAKQQADPPPSIVANAVAKSTAADSPPAVAKRAKSAEPEPAVILPEPTKNARQRRESAKSASAGKPASRQPFVLGAAILTAIILMAVTQTPLLSGYSDEGIWQVQYTTLGVKTRSFFVHLQRRGTGLTGTPVSAGGDGLSGIALDNGTVSLGQRSLVPGQRGLRFDGQGNLSEGRLSGWIMSGGRGTWEANRRDFFYLLVHPPSGEWLRDLFLKSLLGFLLLSFGLIGASVKIFGPNGYINIKSRKQYVPTRHKGDQNKWLSQYGRGLTAGSLPLGTRIDWAPWHLAPRRLNLPADLRVTNPHILAVGGSGKGKTRLLAGMAVHDIECGDRAVIIVDPDGALSDLVVRHIARHPDVAELTRRLRIIDGTRDLPLAFNPIREPSDGQLQNMASSVVAGFRAIYTPAPGQQQTWTQQTAHILRSALLLLAVNGRSLGDLPTLLTDNDERDLLLQTVEARKNECAELLMISESWSRYRKLARSEQWLDWVEPILNRLQPVLGDPKLNAIISSGKHDVDFRSVLENQGVVIVKLPRARFGDHASLVGALVVGCVQNAALSLSHEDDACRHPASLYLDDFSSFLDKDMFQLVSNDTRRYGLGLICSTRSLQEIPEDYRNYVVNNVGNMAAFACAPKDAEALGKQIFRVDGRQAKQRTIQHIFNAVNTAISNYDLIADEEKLNMDRIIGQEDRTFFWYKVSSVAGVFNMRAPDFQDIDRDSVDMKLLARAYRPYKDKK